MTKDDFKIELGGKKVSLDSTIDKYWGEVFPMDYTKEVEPQHKALRHFLLDKYGKNTVEKFDKMAEKYGHCSQEEKNAFIEFTYGNGMYWDASPSYTIQGREILKMLIKKLYEQPPSTILDAGCGDFKIGLGLALYLPNKNIKVHGIENSPAAINRAQKDIQRLQSENLLNGQVSIDNLDYYSDNTIELINNKYKNIDTLLMCRPDVIADAQHFVKEMIDQGTKVIGCYSMTKDPDYNTNVCIDLVLDSINYGMYTTWFRLTESKEVKSQIMLIGEYI